MYSDTTRATTGDNTEEDTHTDSRDTRQKHAGVRKNDLFSTSASACGLAGNLLALVRCDLTLWPAEVCDHKKTLLQLSFAYFCLPSATLLNSESALHIVPNGKHSTTLSHDHNGISSISNKMLLVCLTTRASVGNGVLLLRV